MSDLMTITARWCSSNEHWNIEVPGTVAGTTYKVTWGYDPTGRYQRAYSCTCKGYKYRRECKHIFEAAKQHCRHGEDAAMGSPEEMGKSCPKCGGPTSVISVGV